MFAGFGALMVRKGDTWHRLVGTLFFASMMLMGAGAAALGYLQNSSGDFYGGLLVIYLTTTAWLTVRRAPGVIGKLEYAGLLLVAIVFVSSLYKAHMASIDEAGLFEGRGMVFHLIVAVVAGCWMLGDTINIVKRGLIGKRRLGRHLWRMCFALFAAAAPIFIARVHVFPDMISTTDLRYVLMSVPLIPLMLMPYFGYRVWTSRIG